MKNYISVLVLLFLFLQNNQAQVLGDAVRYSLLEVGGTARTVAIGGGIGALGADFSVLSTNPAGLAAYRRSEFTFTPAYERISTDGKLEGDGNPTVGRNKANFNFNNLGLVIASRPLDAKWRTSVFGIGINRVATFHERSYFEGTSLGSITDRWLERAGTLPDTQLDPFEEDLAFKTGAIFAPDPLYYSDFLDENGELGNILVDKSQTIKRTGSMTELVFSFAGNYDEKLMVGATLGIPIMSYEETRTYRETDESDRIPAFDELTFTEKVRTSGAGINLKLGLIYRMSQMVRLGAAIHSPTSLGLDDAFSTELEYGYTDNLGSQRFTEQSPEGTFEYRLRTPWRAIGSMGVIIAKTGFLSGEVEYVNYRSAKFNFANTTNQSDIANQDFLNQQIDDQLGSGINLRLGGEYALDKFRFRAGYAITASPYEADDEKRGALSFGAGVFGESIFLDLAYRRHTTNRNYAPYAIPTSAAGLLPEPSVDLTTQRSQFLVTLGFKL